MLPGHRSRKKKPLDILKIVACFLFCVVLIQAVVIWTSLQREVDCVLDEEQLIEETSIGTPYNNYACLENADVRMIQPEFSQELLERKHKFHHIPLIPFQLPMFASGGGNQFYFSASIVVENVADFNVDWLAEEIFKLDNTRLAIFCKETDIYQVADVLDEYLQSHLLWWIYHEPYDWEKVSPNSTYWSHNGWTYFGIAQPTNSAHQEILLSIEKLQFPSNHGGESCETRCRYLYKEDFARYYGSLEGVLVAELEVGLLNDCTMVFWLDRRWQTVDIPKICNASYSDTTSDIQSPDPYQCLFLDTSECRMDDFAHKVLEREPKLENSWGHAYYWPGHRVVPYHSYKLLDVEKDDWWIPDGVLPPMANSLGEPYGRFHPDDCHDMKSFSNLLWFRGLAQRALSRLRYKFRHAVSKRVAQAIAEMRAMGIAVDNSPKDNNEELLCVALHIRHGDKLTELAEGMQSRESFNRTLEDYIEKASPLLSEISIKYDRPVTTLLVMSDDPEVQRKAKLITKSDNNPWNVHAIVQDGEPENLEGDKFRAFVFLLASLELFSRCQGMVGNFDSNVSSLLYQLMVYRHGACVPHYTFSELKEWRPLA